MAEKILFTAGKGGVGLTTCIVGISLALAAEGNKVLLVDGDSRSASALTISGCANMQVYTLSDYEAGACRAKQALVTHPKQSNLAILPTLGCRNDKTAERAVAELEGLFDYVLCDDCAEKLCTTALVVTEPYAPSVKATDGRIAELLGNGKKEAGLVLCKVNGGLIYDGAIMAPEEIALILHAPLKAVIPEDLSLPVGKCRSATAKAFKIAALNICGKRAKVYSATKGFGGPKGYFKRKIRSSL